MKEARDKKGEESRVECQIGAVERKQDEGWTKRK